MKQVLSLIAALCLLGGMSYAAELVDDFEGYALGDVATVASPPWTATASTGTINAQDGNQFLTFSNSGSGWGPPLQVDLPFEVSAPATLFFRARASASTGLDHAFGLTDNRAAGWFDQYAAYLRIMPGTTDTTARMDGRNPAGTGFVENIKTLNVGEWYNVWLVVRPQQNSYDIYVNQGVGGATVADLAVAGCGFRKAYAAPLVSFLLYGSAGQNASVDDVYLMEGEDLSNPTMQLFRAHNPNPVHGATGVLLQAALSWNTGLAPDEYVDVNPAITHHYLYFKADDANFLSPATVKALIPATGATGSYSPAGMMADKTYFWRVDQVLNNAPPQSEDPNQVIKGPVWSFSTILSAPVITGHPVFAFGTLGDEAVFTVNYTSFSPAFVRWYKYVDGVNDLLIADGFVYNVDFAKYDVFDTDVLTYARLKIKNVTQADQAQYYAVVYNMEMKEAVSRKGTLILKQMLAHYEFEDDFANSLGGAAGVGLNYPDANLPGPTFVDSMPGRGKAASFIGGNYVDLGTNAFPKAGGGNGIEAGTISMWIKPTLLGNLMANLNDNYRYEGGPTDGVGTTGFGFSLASATQPRMIVRGEMDNPQTYMEVGTVQGGSLNLVTTERWHHVATTWQTGSHVAVYVNGVQVASATGGIPDKFANWQYGVLLGAARTAANRAIPSVGFAGLMDDVMVFNYPLSATEMAELYHSISGTGACLYPTNFTAAYDLNGNCKIDIGDFAILASNWLDCGRYPATTCND